MRSVLVLLSLLVFNLGCQSLELAVPSPKIEAPEAPGRGKFRIGGSASVVGNFVAAENAGERPPDLDNAYITGALAIGPRADVGITDRLSVGLGADFAGVGEGAINGRVMYQLLGSSWDARELGPRLAVWGRVGAGQSSESGDQAVTFGSGKFPWSGSVKDTMAGVGVSYGHRFSHRTLAYFGVAADRHEFKVEIKQEPAENDSDAGGSYSKTYSGVAGAIGGGVTFSWRILSIDIYAAYNEIDFNNNLNMAESASNVTGGIRFLWALNPTDDYDSSARYGDIDKGASEKTPEPPKKETEVKK